jgi:putative transposase
VVVSFTLDMVFRGRQTKKGTTMKESRTKRASRVQNLRPQLHQYVLQLDLSTIRKSLTALCFEAGMAVTMQMLRDDQDRLCGPQGCPNPDRQAYRHGSTKSRMVFGGQTVDIQRPRVRSVAGQELSLSTFEQFANRDPLDEATLSAITLGVSTRGYEDWQRADYGGAVDGHSTAASSVSRRFVALSAQQLEQWLSTSLKALDIPVIMIDGIHIDEHVVLVALGIDAQGHKHVLGLHEGSTEHTSVVAHLLANLIDRGLDQTRHRLWVIDGGKALRRGIMDQFGQSAVIQRCQEHKRRNVLDHLPKALHITVAHAMRQAWASADADIAKRQIQRLATTLEREHPGAAASLREGQSHDVCVHYNRC